MDKRACLAGIGLAEFESQDVATQSPAHSYFHLYQILFVALLLPLRVQRHRATMVVIHAHPPPQNFLGYRGDEGVQAQESSRPHLHTN